MGQKITAIIQARMTSTRLPGKVLMEVMGKPLLSYQIERTRFSKRIGDIIIATTINKEDDPVAELAIREGVEVFRGSENDVLDRYYQAAKKYGAEHIMRLTGDCPLIDPAVCDFAVEEYLKTEADFIHTGPTFAEGLDCEIFSFECLSLAWSAAKLRSEREHCTLYFHNNPEKFKKITLGNATDDSTYRFTVDEPKDFQVVKVILENLYEKGKGYFGHSEIKGFLDSNPDIFNLNRGIMRNEGLAQSLKEDK